MQVHRDLLDAPWVSPELKKAVLELERLQGDQRVRDLYEARCDQERLSRTLIASAKMEGREEGRREGSIMSLRKVAMRMLKSGMPIEQVMAMVDLPREEEELERLAAGQAL